MTLAPGHGVDAATLALETEAVAPELIVSGAPIVGWASLDESEHGEWGVWEITPSVTTDTEVDETFVVIAGRAVVRFPGTDLEPLELGPGVVARLAEGMVTEWTVTETLRKVVLVHA